MIIETERLFLRTVEETDAQAIFEYSSEPNVGPNAGWAPHKTISETREIIRQVFIEKDIFCIIPKKTGTVIGTVGIISDPKRDNDAAGMLGYAMSEKHWGYGYMTEAAKAVIKFGFEMRSLEIITAYCYPHNHRSERVLEKCGMGYEGTLRKCETIFDGTVYDNRCYSITLPEFTKL